MIHQWKGLYEYYNMETEKFEFFSKKFEIDKIEFCPYPEKRNRPGFVNISPTLVIDKSMERSLRVLQHGNRIIWYFSKKFEIDKIEFCPYPKCPYPKKINRPSFVNISPSLVIDTLMEWSSRVLHHGNTEMWKFSKKFEIDEIEFCPYPEFPYAEKRNCPGFVNISPT